jgi:glycerol-3-phosphate acyltransferase PlsY
MLTFLQNSWLALLLAAVIAYLLGSVSFAIIVTRLFSGVDIRSYGSGNAGATNVLRSQGKLPALLTFLGDLGKSMLSVYIGGELLKNLQLLPMSDVGSYTSGNLELVGSYLAGICCVIGHLYPLYFGFRGGKGVMTVLGITLLLDWRTALVLLIVFSVVVLCTRMVSLGSITAGIVMPIVTYLFRTYWYHQPWPTATFCTVAVLLIAVIVILKHRSNIKRILNGTESKIGEKKHG